MWISSAGRCRAGQTVMEVAVGEAEKKRPMNLHNKYLSTKLKIV
jgi:hypothetical protein